jgi:hypothetical protein
MPENEVPENEFPVLDMDAMHAYIQSALVKRGIAVTLEDIAAITSLEEEYMASVGLIVYNDEEGSNG